MGPFETATAALTLANTMAEIHKMKLQALSGPALAAYVTNEQAIALKAIADLQAFAIKIASAVNVIVDVGKKIVDKVKDIGAPPAAA